jgi:SAM-dependent methyltransferase
MEPIRKPLQGVWNIIRFNWHFYLLTIGLVLVVGLLGRYLDNDYRILSIIVCCLIIFVTVVSLLISFYVYDLSGLYKLNWLNELSILPNSKMVNIHAGFDESSVLLHNKFPGANLAVYDFYDPLKHTEVSIKRARKAYPPFPNTRHVETTGLPLKDEYADTIFVIFSAHEIRSEAERNVFFHELKRILKPAGKIVVTEHLRDVPNFLAYNIGFFHFIAASS